MRDYIITEASINDIEEIIKLKLKIWKKMDNKDWYVIDGTDYEFIKKQIDNDGLVLKTVYQDEIVGFLIVENDLKYETSILKYLNLQDEYKNCIELCNAAVDYNHRGNNLQILMIKKAEEIMKQRYKFKYIISTVHPDNLSSMKSLIKLGYQIMCTTKLYGGKDRCVLMKNISCK